MLPWSAQDKMWGERRKQEEKRRREQEARATARALTREEPRALTRALTRGQSDPRAPTNLSSPHQPLQPPPTSPAYSQEGTGARLEGVRGERAEEGVPACREARTTC